jgi:hypothetical protein
LGFIAESAVVAGGGRRRTGIFERQLDFSILKRGKDFR